MWWGTAAMIVFWGGAVFCKRKLLGRFKARIQAKKKHLVLPLITPRMTLLVLLYQILSLPIMSSLAASGHSIYTSALGAYMYDLPVVLQSGHVFAVIVFLERYRRRRAIGSLIPLIVSAILFLFFTWIMREVSMFRGFYIAGIMIVGIAALQHMHQRVSYAWLIMPIVLVQPLFRTMGESRYLGNEFLGQTSLIERTFANREIAATYWDFYDGGGDINILDTFVAAQLSKPSKRPYILSWLYVPVHLVPRAIWKSKPKQGILQDVTFMNGAPYCPGIAGFFLLDGGKLWMLLCMFTLGFILCYVDYYVLTMPDSYGKSCSMVIRVCKAMFLSRFFLWQAFYQYLYAIVPVIIMDKLLSKKIRLATDKRKSITKKQPLLTSAANNL